MTSRLKKFLLVAAGLLLAVVLALVVLVKVLVTEERVRQTLVPLVESSLQRKLQLGAVDIGMLSGIRLADVVLYETDGRTEFAGVDAVELRYRFWPLLLLRVEIDTVRLDRPRLRLVREADGRFNFADLVTEREGAEPPPAPVPADNPLDLRVARLVLNDGAVLYRDLSVQPPVEHRLRALQVELRDFSLREPFAVTASADWNGHALAIKGSFDLDDRAVRATFTLNRLQLQVEGDLLRDARGERLRAALQVPRIALADLIASLPEGSVPLPAGIDPGGHLALTAKLDGLLSEPAALLREAQLDLDALAAQVAGVRPQLTGRIGLVGRKLAAENLQMALGGEKVALTFSCDDLLSRPLAVDARLTARSFDLDRALPAPSAATVASATAPATPSQEVGPYDLPLRLRGEVGIDSLRYKGVVLEPLQARFTLRDNLLQLESLVAGSGDGRLQGNGRVDLNRSGLDYQGKLVLSALQVNPLVKALKPALGDSLYGVVDGAVDFRGRGTLPETVKKQLSASGDLRLADGRLAALPLLDAAAALLALPTLREVHLAQGEVAFTLADGVVQLTSRAGGSKVRTAVQGGIGLDGRFALSARVGLSPELSQQLDRKGALGRVLSDAEGWTTVPLTISGQAVAPKVAVDSRALARQAAGNALERLGEAVNRRRPQADAPPGEAAPEKAPLKQVLQDLLGR